MNLQSYQECINSLEKEIASREQQRQQMALTIEQLDDNLQSQITCNQSFKQQINILSRANQQLQQILHQKIAIIDHQQHIINQSIEKDDFMQKKVTMLETQKKNLQQQLANRDGLIIQINNRVKELEAQNGKNGSLIEGYRNVVNEKAKHSAQLQSKLTSTSQSNTILQKQLSKLKAQHEQQTHRLNQQASSTIQQLGLKIISLSQQMQELKQIQKNQLNTIQFTHGQEMEQVKKEERFLRGEVMHYLEVIEELKQQLQINRVELANAKQQCQRFNLGKDEIVNQLINQINFLKQQKVQIQKKSSLQIETITQQIIKIGLEKVVYMEKEKQLQHQISLHQQQNNQLQSQFKLLTLDHNKLSFQKDFCLQKLETEKSVLFQKDEQINQLRQQIERANKIVQSIKKEKQTINDNTSIELIMLRHHNIDLERNLLATQTDLQEQRINCVQLEEQIKQLAYDQIKAQKTIQDLIKVIQNHQSTLLNMKALLDQSNKVITELNLTINAKLQEIQALQNSNHIFRKQKLQWLQKYEECRKKTYELKTVRSTQRLNRASTDYFASSRSQSRLKTIHEGYSRSALSNGRGYQQLQHVYSASVINNPGEKDALPTPIRWLERISLPNQSQPLCFAKLINQNYIKTPCYHSSSSNEQQLQDHQANTQVQRRQKTSRLRSSQSHEVDLSTLGNRTMKKKDKKLQYVFENGEANHNYEMKKDYSLGKIRIRKQSD